MKFALLFVIIFAVLAHQPASADLACQITFERRAVSVPAKLGLQQVGRIQGIWLKSQYSFDLNRWRFYDRFMYGQEYTQPEREKSERLELMSFTYDVFSRRTFKSTAIDGEKFLSTMRSEDSGASDDNTTYFGFVIDHQTVATAKVSLQHPGQTARLPVFQKLPRAEKILKEKFGDQTLVELGRLAKINKVSIETIFASISHYLIQNRSVEGLIVGHTAPHQAVVYEKLGFHLTVGDQDLEPDQVIVTMPIREFILRFPPHHAQVTLPHWTSHLDEMFLISETRAYLP